MSMSIKRVLACAAATAVLFLGSVSSLFAQGAGGAPFRLILTHLEPPLVPNSVMDLALELGYFEREGVNVQLVRVQQTPLASTALLAGQGEMANIAVDEVLRLVGRGVAPDLWAVSSPNKSLPFLIAARDSIADVAGLAGRPFGIGSLGSLDHSLSVKVLQEAGLNPQTLQLLSIGQPAVRAQVLLQGQVDATTMSIGVWLAMPDREGLHVLIDQEAYYNAAPVIQKVNVVLEETLRTRRDEVLGVLRALVKISRDYAADPELWAAAMDPIVPNVARDELEALARTFDGTWSVNGGMNEAELQYTQDWIYETADFATVPPIRLDQWVDFSLMDEVLRDLGVDESSDPPGREIASDAENGADS